MMTSLTITDIPDELIERLRAIAARERRSLNQQAIVMLGRALANHPPGFMDVYNNFTQNAGSTPLESSDLNNLRDPASGRSQIN